MLQTKMVTIDLRVFKKKLKCRIINKRRQQRPMTIGHLSESGDLKS